MAQSQSAAEILSREGLTHPPDTSVPFSFDTSDHQNNPAFRGLNMQAQFSSSPSFPLLVSPELIKVSTITADTGVLLLDPMFDLIADNDVF